MIRFFCDKNDIYKEKIVMEGDDVAHMKDVLRLKQGDYLTICDGNKNDYTCTVAALTKKEATLNIVEKKINDNEPTIHLTLFQALPKTPKVEIIVQKAVELGVESIVFFESERSVQKIKDEKDVEKKLERWQKIAKAAAMQSQRGIVPVIDYVDNFKATTNYSDTKDTLHLVAYEEELGLSLKAHLNNLKEEITKDIAIYIGPEGGFATHEIELMKKSGITPVSLGKRILRTETAAIVTVALIMYEIDT